MTFKGRKRNDIVCYNQLVVDDKSIHSFNLTVVPNEYVRNGKKGSTQIIMSKYNAHIYLLVTCETLDVKLSLEIRDGGTKRHLATQNTKYTLIEQSNNFFNREVFSTCS